MLLLTCSSGIKECLTFFKCSRLYSTKLAKILRRSLSAGSSSRSSPAEDLNRQQAPPPVTDTGGEVRSWQIHSYGGISELHLTTSGRIPTIKSPTDVLVKVNAASLNPIDLAMTKGYGAETLNVIRGIFDPTETGVFGLPKLKQMPLPFSSNKTDMIEFPLTLGRDFAGIVVDMGHGAKGKSGLRIGDEVYGVVGVQRQGSHADYVLTAVDTIRRKPKNLSFTEAASIPYVALTTWSAINVTGGFRDLSQKKFLILGGSGGIGTFAVQYLKAQGAHVVTTCSADAASLMVGLGSDYVIDYKLPDISSLIQQHAPFDCILHLSGATNVESSMENIKHLKPVVGQFITLSPPFLSNMDKFGLLGGTMKNLGDLLSSNMKSWNKGNALAKWAFFIPNGCSLETVADLLESQKIEPVIQETFKFEDTPAAYRKMEEGHLRGKIVIDMQ